MSGVMASAFCSRARPIQSPTVLTQRCWTSGKAWFNQLYVKDLGMRQAKEGSPIYFKCRIVQYRRSSEHQDSNKEELAVDLRHRRSPEGDSPVVSKGVFLCVEEFTALHSLLPDVTKAVAAAVKARYNMNWIVLAAFKKWINSE